MDVTFRSAELAALCNSERHLADRWGVDAGRTVGRRLLELCAADVRSLHRLPRAEVSRNGQGETIIDFGEVVVQGVISGDGADTERIVITSLVVQGGVQE